MVQRFNPPPGWPAPPLGWLPPAGWRPPAQAPPGLPPIPPHWPWLVKSHHRSPALVIALLGLAGIALVGLVPLLRGGGLSHTCYFTDADDPVSAQVVGPGTCAGDATLLATKLGRYWSPISAEAFRAGQSSSVCSLSDGSRTVTIYVDSTTSGLQAGIGAALASHFCGFLQGDGWTTR